MCVLSTFNSISAAAYSVPGMEVLAEPLNFGFIHMYVRKLLRFVSYNLELSD